MKKKGFSADSKYFHGFQFSENRQYLLSTLYEANPFIGAVASSASKTTYLLSGKTAINYENNQVRQCGKNHWADKRKLGTFTV